MKRPLLLALLALGLATPAAGRDLFTAEISIGGGTPGRVGVNSARDVPDLFGTSVLTGIDPGYDATQALSATVDLRGLAATVSFNALDDALRFQVPGAGIDVTFDGVSSRDEAIADFQEWLEGEFSSASASGSAATWLMQALVANSPVDPMAGNPNSLQSRMFDADWRMGTGGAVARLEQGAPPVGGGVKLGGGFAWAGDFDQHAIDLPLHFRARLSESVGLAMDVPLAVTNTQGAWTGLGSLALGLHVQPFSIWTLSPAVRVGGTGSVDLGGVGAFYSGSLTSNIRIPLGPFAIGMANMAGLARSIDGIEVSGYGLSYELQNSHVRNGLYAEMGLGSELLGTGLAVRLEVSDARFFGDELWLDTYQEIGAALAGGLPIGDFQLGVAYQIGRDYDGVSARLGLRF